MGIDLGIPVAGQAQLNWYKGILFDGHRDRVNEGFSTRSANGSIGTVTSNTEATIALGAAQMGAIAWMQSGGDTNKYNEIRSSYVNKLRGAELASALSLNPAAMTLMDAQTRNFDRGAATAKGFNLNAYTTENLATANRALATKLMSGYFMNTSNQDFTPTINGTLRATGYAQAQQERRAATRSVGVR